MKAFLFTLLLLPATVFAQYGEFPMPLDGATRRVMYREVTKVDGASASELYKRAKLWLYDITKSPKWCSKVDDPQAGTLIVDVHLSHYEYTSMGLPLQSFVEGRLKVEAQDGKYRYTLTNLEYIDNQDSQPNRLLIEAMQITTGRQRKMVQGLDKEIRKILADLTKAMAQETAADW